MIQKIGAGHTFSKSEWPGGDSSLPLIILPVKKSAGVHKNHVITRKKKVSSSSPMSVRKPQSKPRRRQSSRSAPVSDQHCTEDVIGRLQSLEAELSATKTAFAEQIKRLTDQAAKTDRRFRAIKYHRARKLSTHHSFFSSVKKSRKRGNNITLPTDPLDNAAPTSPQPNVLVGDGVNHNWAQYEHVFGVSPPPNIQQVCINFLSPY